MDNFQICHSAQLDDDGRGPEGCAYNAGPRSLVVVTEPSVPGRAEAEGRKGLRVQPKEVLQGMHAMGGRFG